MRRLAPRFAGPTVRRALSESVFIRQARFMADFEDDYQKLAPFSMFYPYYQMMSYEQLRTYFTWRNMSGGARHANGLRRIFSSIFTN
jgi:hypothetical protein